MRPFAFVTLLVCFLASSEPATAQCVAQKLQASNGEFDDIFGASVDTDDRTLLVGAVRPDPQEPGRVYVFERTNAGWVETDIWQFGAAPVGDYFGHSVAVDGDRALVGLFYEPPNPTVRVFAYERSPSGWTRVQTILPPGPVGSSFSAALELEGDRAVVTAPGDAGRGAAYVYGRGPLGWELEAKLSAADSVPGDSFGSSVALDGDRILVGAWAKNHADGQYAGAAYVFELRPNGWEQIGKLLSDDPGPAHFFGGSAALAGDVAVVGAPFYKPVGAPTRGAAFVYELDDLGAWNLVARLEHEDMHSWDQLGTDVATDGQRILVGHPADHTAGEHAGAMQLYERTSDGWVWRRRMVDPLGGEFEGFGASVALTSDELIATAPSDDLYGDFVGTVWIFDSNGPGRSESYCAAALNSTGERAHLIQRGTLSLSGAASSQHSALRMRVEGAVPAQALVFVYGTESAAIPLGGGRLCIGGELQRLSPLTIVGDDGAAEIVVDLDGAPAGSGPAALSIDTTWYFQAIYRDPSAGTLLLSDALSIEFCR